MQTAEKKQTARKRQTDIKEADIHKRGRQT